MGLRRLHHDSITTAKCLGIASLLNLIHLVELPCAVSIFFIRIKLGKEW